MSSARVQRPIGEIPRLRSIPARSLSISHMLWERHTLAWSVGKRRDHKITVNGNAVRVFDGSQAGDYMRPAGGVLLKFHLLVKRMLRRPETPGWLGGGRVLASGYR